MLTKKGKGCPYAEAHPELYHGVGPFDPVTGEIQKSGACFSEVFGENLCAMAERDKKIVAITAAMASGTGLDQFARRFPGRFVDAGIAEGHAVAFAAGMAKQGMTPVFAVYSSFLQRGFDMLIHDVSLQGLHVVFGVDRAGIVGSDGETHHGIFDLSYLGTVPGMQILCPASFAELREQMEMAISEMQGPVALRYPRGGEGEYQTASREEEQLIREGSDVTIVCCGVMVNEALAAARILENRGISAEIVKINLITQKDYPVTLASLHKTGHLIAAEEVCAAGCLGSRILSQACEKRIPFQAARLLNLGKGIVAHGDRKLLMRDAGIDAESIASAAAELCEKTKL